MLPGPLLLPPPPPTLVLTGYPSVLIVSPSATPSSSIGSSIAIIAIVVIAAAILTCAIVVLRRGYRHRRLSCSSFSPRCSFSPTTPSSSSSAQFEMQCATSAAVGARSRAIHSESNAGKVPVAHSAEGSSKVAGLTASSTASAVPVIALSGLEHPAPSAPSLPEVERVIFELLSLPPMPVKPGSGKFCLICNRDFIPADMLLALPVCLHRFHQSCIITWLRSATSSCCPFCFTILCPDKTSLAPSFCSAEYDIEAQMVAVPAPPGEEVAGAVGGSRGWLRSSLDRLSGSWRGCSSNRATAVVVPASSRCSTGSWRLDSIGHLGIDSCGIQTQMQLPVPPAEAKAEVGGGSHGWLRSYLATLPGSWSGFSNSRSTEMVLPVTSRRTTGSFILGSSGSISVDPWSRSWDPDAVAPTQEKSSVFGYARWLFRNSG